jgi:hypothetical protein
MSYTCIKLQQNDASSKTWQLFWITAVTYRVNKLTIQVLKMNVTLFRDGIKDNRKS